MSIALKSVIKELARRPGLDSVATVLGFPFFQQLMIAAFGFNDLPVMRVLVLLYLAGAARSLFSNGRSSTSARLRIQHVDDVTQIEAVFGEQVTQFGLKLDFFLQLRAALERFELS
ncbi:hypothetical protein O162_35070 [Pseudomonas putida SJ3]|nr:hypothetical protein O162_35070 [Pseudomonas putida SJ3]MBA6140849.1 hypothetical protein [Pseudomonas monteilii]